MEAHLFLCGRPDMAIVGAVDSYVYKEDAVEVVPLARKMHGGKVAWETCSFRWWKS